MSWRLKIVHTTRFAYDSVAHASYNEARLTPPTLLTQTTLESRVEIEPAAPLYRYYDYWGTQVSAFDLDDEHSELVVTATSTVETTQQHLGPNRRSPGLRCSTPRRQTGSPSTSRRPRAPPSTTNLSPKCANTFKTSRRTRPPCASRRGYTVPSNTCPGRPVCRPVRARRGTAGKESAKTSPTCLRACCAASAFRPVTCRATYTPSAMRWSAKQ